MPLIKGGNFMKFKGIRRIIGTVYSNMSCDESLKKYIHILLNQKKLRN